MQNEECHYYAKDRYKTTFVIGWGTFVWMLMPFGVKNGPANFQIVVNKTFRKYLDQFMNIFLDHFTVYHDMESHLMKFRFCFQKFKKYKINLIQINARLWYFQD